MTQLIKPKAINFNELVKNSNTTLSLNLETKMINILNTEFTEEEQQWYIANLFMYMNYHPTNDYPINLEDVFKMIGFANKGNAMKTIKSNFTLDEDYKTSLLPKEKSSWGGSGSEQIMLNVDTFKNLCMLAKTDKGKQIRKYYVKLENIYNQIIKEEIEEKNELLQEQQNLLEATQNELKLKDTLLEDLENKPNTFGFGRKSGYNYIVKDNSNKGHYKIGLADRVDSRLSALNTSSSTKSLELVSKIFSCDKELSEKLIHNILHPFRINNPNQKNNEWFYLKNDYELAYAIKTMKECINFIKEHDFKDHNEFKNKNENLKLNDVSSHQDIVEDNLITENIQILNDYMIKNNKSSFRGVTWIQEKSKWKSEFQYNCKRHFLGHFIDEIDAAKVYNDYSAFLNKTEDAKLVLNNIPGYITVPRNVPELNKLEQNKQKTSQYNGVSYDSKRKYYVVSIKFSGKTYNLGSSLNETDCAKIYNQQALYFNNQFNTKYVLNNIPDFITEPKDFREEIKPKKTSKYHGVSLTNNNKWACSYMLNRKKIHIGTFDTELEACNAYNKIVNELNKNGCKYRVNQYVDE
jgi:phage anti-repressor protein